MAYAIIVKIHVLTAILSLIGFVVRAAWKVRSPEKLSRKWVKIAPHINDTLMLVSAVVLLFILGLAPWDTGWVAAKILGLLVYIGLGIVALKKAQTPWSIFFWTLAALAVYVYILLVAKTKMVLPQLTGL
jgi:uncharacterized membrane protein SirB2